jgi:hypothetical protein
MSKDFITVSRSTGKVSTQWAPINKYITSDDTDVLPLRQDIETGCLACR